MNTLHKTDYSDLSVFKLNNDLSAPVYEGFFGKGAPHFAYVGVNEVGDVFFKFEAFSPFAPVYPVIGPRADDGYLHIEWLPFDANMTGREMLDLLQNNQELPIDQLAIVLERTIRKPGTGVYIPALPELKGREVIDELGMPEVLFRNARGKLHREDGPAVFNSTYVGWYRHGRLVRSFGARYKSQVGYVYEE